jgi:hypothetical protein
MPRLDRLALRAVLAAAALAGSARAEIGVVDPRAWGARFDPDAAARAVFCIRPDGPATPNTCASAFLISAQGYVLTAHHVDSPADSRHPAKTDWSPGAASKQVLIDARGTRYRLHLVKYLAAEASNKPFVKDPTKLMRLRFMARTYGTAPAFDILEEIDPQNYDQFDAVLLKIDDADLHLLKEAGIEPLPLRRGPPQAGERLFLAGWPWAHYPNGWFNGLRDAISAAHPGRPAARNTDGGFSYLTGLCARVQSRTVVTQATPEQAKGKDPDTDAIDSFWGDSGGALLDADGRVVGVHWGSDNVADAAGAKAIVTFATSIDDVREAFGLGELGL